MLVIDLARNLTSPWVPSRRLQPIGQAFSDDGDLEDTTKRSVAGYGEGNFSNNGRQSANLECRRFLLHVQRHGIQGSVENSLFVKLVEKGGQ